MAALEFEFYLIDAAGGEHGAPLVPRSARLGRRPGETEVFAPERMEDQEPFFELVDRYCEAQELPIKGALCEFAPGQFEINLGHVDDMLLAADQGVLLKRCIKAAARATGQRATFMAKPFAEQSGSGLHVHLSLVDGEGRNLFGETPDGERQLAPRGPRPAGPDGRVHAGVRAQRQQLPPAPPAHLRADRADLGLEQPHRRPAHPAGRPGGAADRAPRRRLRRQPLPGARRGAGRRAARAWSSGASPGPPIVGNAYAQSPATLPLTWEAALDAFRGAERLPRLARRALLQAVRRRPPGRARPVPRPDHAHRVRVVPDDGVTESPCAPFSVGTFLTSTRTHSRNALTSGRSAVARGDTK